MPALVRWGAGNPSYRPIPDDVVMPAFDAFHTAPDAYGTLAHELTHWTGHSTRLARTYGTRTEQLLKGVESIADLGEDFGGGLHVQEVDYLVANEWAQTAEDILFRRTKLGLHVSPDGVSRLMAYLAGR